MLLNSPVPFSEDILPHHTTLHIFYLLPVTLPSTHLPTTTFCLMELSKTCAFHHCSLGWDGEHAMPGFPCYYTAHHLLPVPSPTHAIPSTGTVLIATFLPFYISLGSLPTTTTPYAYHISLPAHYFGRLHSTHKFYHHGLLTTHTFSTTCHSTTICSSPPSFPYPTTRFLHT